MPRPRIKLKSSEMRDLLKSEQMRPPLESIADGWANAARSSAPVASGEYRAGIVRDSGTTDRAVERVVATAPHSALVEARTGNLKRAMGGA